MLRYSAMGFHPTYRQMEPCRGGQLCSRTRYSREGRDRGEECSEPIGFYESSPLEAGEHSRERLRSLERRVRVRRRDARIEPKRTPVPLENKCGGSGGAETQRVGACAPFPVKRNTCVNTSAGGFLWLRGDP